MSYKPGVWGNLPPGVHENDKDAPWNEPECPEFDEEELLNFLYEHLIDWDYPAEYDGDSVAVGQLRVVVIDK